MNSTEGTKIVAMPSDMYIEPDQDPRTDPPTAGSELATLTGFLGYHRATLELKCSGLDAEALARRSVEPSTLSLLGLLRHLADVERGWFRRLMADQDAPPRFYSAEDPDGDFDNARPDPAVVAEAWQAWREEIAFADQLVAAAPSLDVLGKRETREPISLRWVLIHMIEEYCRHNGHADLLRERIDGAVGE
jgi:uncharacterized damage-inducible protein DinB